MTRRRILITGSRAWTDREAIRRVLAYGPTKWSCKPGQITVVHGGARGADRIAGEVAAELGMAVEVYPADWEAFGKSAGYRRNKEMVEAGADVVLAWPLGESRGTRMCMALAEQAGIPVRNHGDPEPEVRLAG